MSENFLKPDRIHSDLEEILLSYHEKVGESLKVWRKAEADRKQLGALKFLKAKGQGMSVAEAEANRDADSEFYQAKMVELEAEGNHRAIEETLLATKKLCDHRTAF